MEDDIKYLALGEITKTYRQPDGSVIVEGRLGGETLDLDGQRLSKEWLDGAVPKWASRGNIRAMHQPIAAGKALQTEDRGADWFLTAKIVDPIEAMKCEQGIYTGWSVGVKNGGWVVTKDAPNGLINKGDIVEVSLADNPCDPANSLNLVSKTAVAELTDEDLEKALEPDVVKRDFTAADRKRMAGEGKAMPDGSFPIANEEDLHNAVRLAGHAKNPAAAKKHIIERARAMGLTSALPDDWKADSRKMAFEEIVVSVAEDAELLQLLRKIVNPETEKSAQNPAEDDSVAPAVENADCEDENEPEDTGAPTDAEAKDDVSYKAASPCTCGPDCDCATTKVTSPDLSKFVTADNLKVTLADTIKASLSEVLKPLEDRIAEMEKRAAPGGPAVVKRQFDAPEDIQKALLAKRVDSLRGLLNHPDPRVQQDAYNGLQSLGQ